MAEWNHPRRADKETLSYLSQIEPVIDQFADDDPNTYEDGNGDGVDEDDEVDVGREQMLENVLDELKHQTASIMEDKYGSVVAEKIARCLTPPQLRVMLSRCRGYMLSLANNRYSSHVLQTLLSLVGKVVEAEISSPDESADQGDTNNDKIHLEGSTFKGKDHIGLMQDIVLTLVGELKGTWAELLDDVSGSHTGRGFLQVLGGLPILSERRGKHARHSHSVGTAVNARCGGTTRGGGHDRSQGFPCANVDPEAFVRWSTPIKHRVPPSFESALTDITAELATLPAGELQGLACSTSGCPLFVMILRVYANLALDPASGRLPSLKEVSTAMDLVTKILQWEDEDRSAEVVYAMSGESTASHFLEAVLWLSPERFFQEMYRRFFESRLLEFCEHGVSNFLIQAALQRVEDRPIAEKIVGAVGDLATDLLRSRRAGVLWRAAQACVRLSLKPQIQTKLLQDVAGAVHAGHMGMAAPPAQVDDDVHAIGEGAEDEKDGRTSPAPSDPFKSAREWVPALLSPRVPHEGSGRDEGGSGRGLDRLFLNVPGARIVQNVLLFDPPVAAPVMKAVAALPEAVLAAVARDNIGSRCLLDPILDEAVRETGGKGRNKPAVDARRTVLRAFRGHLVAMACDRVGWHVLLKCFRGVDMKEKRAMVEELAGGGVYASSRMSGYPSGRSVLTECMVERFSRSPREWEDAFRNRENRAKILDDILAVGSSTKVCKGGKADAKGETARRQGDDENCASEVASPASEERCDARGGDGDGDGDGDGIAEEVVGAAGRGKRRRQRGRGKRGRPHTGEAEDAGSGAKREGAPQAAIKSENDDSSYLGPPLSSWVKRSRGRPVESEEQGLEAEDGADAELKRDRVKTGATEAQKKSVSMTKKARKQRGESLEENAVAMVGPEPLAEGVEEQSTGTVKLGKKLKKRKNREKGAPTAGGGNDETHIGDASITPGESQTKSTAGLGVSCNEVKMTKKKKRDTHAVIEVAAKEAATTPGKRKKKASSKGSFRLF